MSDSIFIGDLRRLTGEPTHIINHAIQRFGPEPRGRIGISRFWSSDDLPLIQASLRRTAEHSSRPERRFAPEDLAQ
ncbi:MAG TPA: hypothetical protein VHX65_12790 [Pirellulales bacterium]|jgi:hypothetical protein|nr:hypothetical protein [Pirellulales bacterium]